MAVEPDMTTLEPGAIGTVILWRDANGTLHRAAVSKRNRQGIVTEATNAVDEERIVLADRVVRPRSTVGGYPGPLGMGQFVTNIAAVGLDDTIPTQFPDQTTAATALRPWLQKATP